MVETGTAAERESANAQAAGHAAEAARDEVPGILTGMRKLKCDVTITNHVAASMGAGFIPLQFVDFAAVTGLQVDMLYRLCKIYDVAFSKEAARSIVTSLIGGAAPGVPARLLASGLKLIPGVGTIAGMVISPVLTGASTYAVGRVFVQHLDSGGTLLTFDSRKMKTHFERAFHEGKHVAAEMAHQ